MSIEHSPSAKSRGLVEQAIDEAMEDLAQRNQARAQRDAARDRSPRNRVIGIGLAIALPLLVAVVVWNVTGLPAIAARYVGSPATRQQVEAAVQTVVDDIEAFVLDYGELPVSLAEIGLPTRGDWQYERISNDRYRLHVSLGGQVVSVDGR